MDQKQFRMKAYLLCILFVLIFVPRFNVSAKKQNKPNIIFLMTDDQRWDNMGCYGNADFPTPHIDQLAKEGIIFDNAVFAVAICMPSRVTMMTGRYLSNHHVGFAAPTNYTLSAADFANSYPAKLKEAGYRNGFIGKVGFRVTEKARWSSTTKPKDYTYKQFLGKVFDYFAGAESYDHTDLEIWPNEDVELQKIYRKERSATERTLKTGDAMLRFIDTQPKNQPFCLSVSFYAVKHDRDADMYGPYYKMFKDRAFNVPENWVEGANELLPQVVKDYARGHRLHLQRSSTPQQYQRLVQRFATQGYSVDAQVGRLMKKLKEKGLLENTIIIYTSDNGRFQGSHGLFDKCLLYEESIKQPLIVYDGRIPDVERQRREAALVSSVDIAPTILALAGLEEPESMQGSSFTGILNQTQNLAEWQDAVFMEDRFLQSMVNKTVAQNKAEVEAGKSYRSMGVRTKRWKYIVYHEQDPKIEELYDLQSDPQEQINLVNDLEFSAVVERLRKRTETLYADIARPVKGE